MNVPGRQFGVEKRLSTLYRIKLSFAGLEKPEQAIEAFCLLPGILDGLVVVCHKESADSAAFLAHLKPITSQVETSSYARPSE